LVCLDVIYAFKDRDLVGRLVCLDVIYAFKDRDLVGRLG